MVVAKAVEVCRQRGVCITMCGYRTLCFVSGYSRRRRGTSCSLRKTDLLNNTCVASGKGTSKELTLELVTKTQRGSRSIAVLFLGTG